jgi:SAM-dependent methyltransferase
VGDQQGEVGDCDPLWEHALPMTAPSRGAPCAGDCDCTPADPGAAAVGDHFDREIYAEESSSSELLFSWLLEAGLAGHTILDLGCGSGRLLVRAIGAGAIGATGMDLSANSIAAAADRLATAGFADRCGLLVDDAAETPLPEHDFVSLDKVVCCYPDPIALVDHSAGAARSVYAIVTPESRGVWGILVRVRRAVLRTVDRVIGRDSPRFLPHVDAVEAHLSAAGFVPLHTGRRGIWFVGVYVRA